MLLLINFGHNVHFFLEVNNVHLRLLRIHADLYLYIAIIGLYVIVFKLNLNIYGP